MKAAISIIIWRFLKGALGVKTLNDLKPGQLGVVEKIVCDKGLRRRIVDMGITPGALVIMKRIAPFGDPIEINVRGFDLSIRKSEAQNIQIKERK